MSSATVTAPGPWRRRARRLRHQWTTIAALTVLWVLLWGDLSWANLIAGALLGAVLVTVLPLPSVETRGRLRVVPFLVLAGRFLVDLFAASFHVAWLALRPGPAPRSGIVGVCLASSSEVFLTITAEMTSLVPGSVVVEAHRSTRMLYLHVLDLPYSGGPDGVRETTLALEARVLRAFASDDELVRLGLAAPGDPLVRRTARQAGRKEGRA
ncbi:Na+/H+ antiporter subunit E [Puerhibacterium sp. TATVAM-FAB25]|uniref:Na+/H+ antiporter subunit E n=1 Tax=Puerhibacterium sp. TATVAM-FAB25 TaxID=3093699 RepID=UPI00397DCE49